MKIELDQLPGELRITAYTANTITVAGNTYTDNIIIGNDSIIENCLPQTIQQLTIEHLDSVLLMQPEIVLFGTGDRISHPADTVIQALFENNIGMEIMDTGAACRSFNFLLGESRKIAGLMFIQD